MELYADEDFPLEAVEELRRLGYDVLTVQDDDRRGVNDCDVLARAHELARVVLTHNRRHFERLHQNDEPHSGILSATQDPGNEIALARRISDKLAKCSPGRWCMRVNRPPS